MRRKDREILELNEIIKIIDRCDVCHIGMTDKGLPYVVPMSFGYAVLENRATFYFHCAGEGRKIDLLRKDPRVCLQFDCSHRLITGEKACDCSTEYESAVAFGIAEFITDPAEKTGALTRLMEHYRSGGGFRFDDRIVRQTAVFKVTAEQISGKRKHAIKEVNS
ncbi:hypothetical protein A7X67_00220 [Clostridium sp. W14A]|nr:hypothetical protein A7X67_00220 [Clostridium sp. W14A]